MDEQTPLPVVVRQHTKSGRFAPGNKLGRGSPLAGRAMRLRAALLKAVRPADIAEIVQAMLESAKAGDTGAAKELLDRTIGKPANWELLERLEILEKRLAQQNREV